MTRCAIVLLAVLALAACQPAPTPHVHCRTVSGQTECRPMP